MNTTPELEVEFWKKEAEKWRNLALRLLMDREYRDKKEKENEQGV